MLDRRQWHDFVIKSVRATYGEHRLTWQFRKRSREIEGFRTYRRLQKSKKSAVLPSAGCLFFFFFCGNTIDILFSMPFILSL